MTVAFVFQGGSSLAAAQVGMLRALLESGIRPDLVVGTSAGALNAVAFAQNPTPAGLEELELLWTRVRRRAVFQLRPGAAFAGLLGRSDGFISPAPLRSWLVRGVRLPDLLDAVIPVGVVATDADSGAPLLLRSGSAIDALLASAAIPGIFPAVRSAGRRLVDGGIAADLPILQAEEMGATISYVLPRAVADGAGRHHHGVVRALLRTTNQLLTRSSERDVAAARHDVRVLPAPVSAATTPFDFRDSQHMIQDGYVAARTWLTSETCRPKIAGSLPLLLDQRPAEYAVSC